MPSIRNIAVGFHVRSDHVLLLDGADHIKGMDFHRAIGGGIEFGETAEAALRREFREELDVAVDRAELLGVIENLFEYEGQPGHEIVHVFGIESEELAALPLDAHLHILDEGSPVSWRPINSLDRPLYPFGTLELL